MFAAMLKDTNEADRLKRSAEQRDRMQEIIDNIEAKSEGTRAEHTAGIETVEQTTRLGSVQMTQKGATTLPRQLRWIRPQGYDPMT